MAKFITKFKFLKPNTRQSVGGYAKYIATREGVEKIDESFKLELASQKQEWETYSTAVGKVLTGELQTV